MTTDFGKTQECHAAFSLSAVSDIPEEDLHDPERYCSVQDLEDFLFQTFPHLSQKDIRHIAHDITYFPEKSTKEMLEATYGVVIDDAFLACIDNFDSTQFPLGCSPYTPFHWREDEQS